MRSVNIDLNRFRRIERERDEVEIIMLKKNGC